MKPQIHEGYYSTIRSALLKVCACVESLAEHNPSPEKDKVIVEMQRELLTAVRASLEGERRDQKT